MYLRAQWYPLRTLLLAVMTPSVIHSIRISGEDSTEFSLGEEIVLVGCDKASADESADGSRSSAVGVECGSSDPADGKNDSGAARGQARVLFVKASSKDGSPTAVPDPRSAGKPLLDGQRVFVFPADTDRAGLWEPTNSISLLHISKPSEASNGGFEDGDLVKFSVPLINGRDCEESDNTDIQTHCRNYGSVKDVSQFRAIRADEASIPSAHSTLAEQSSAPPTKAKDDPPTAQKDAAIQMAVNTQKDGAVQIQKDGAVQMEATSTQKFLPTTPRAAKHRVGRQKSAPEVPRQKVAIKKAAALPTPAAVTPTTEADDAPKTNSFEYFMINNLGLREDVAHFFWIGLIPVILVLVVCSGCVFYCCLCYEKPKEMPVGYERDYMEGAGDAAGGRPAARTASEEANRAACHTEGFLGLLGGDGSGSYTMPSMGSAAAGDSFGRTNSGTLRSEPKNW